MSTTLPLNSAALTILQQVGQSAQKSDQPETAGNAVLAVANGLSVESISGAKSQAQAKISGAFISTEADAKVVEQKMHMFRSLGKEFGLDMDSFKDSRRYASAVRTAVEKMREAPGGSAVLAEIAQRLGYNDLGVTIDDVVNAIDDPDGEGSKKLDSAIRTQLGLPKHAATEDAKTQLADLLKVDDTGLYGRS